MSKTNTKGLLRSNNVFRKIWFAHLLSKLGDDFYDVAIVWYLVDRTGSALLAGGIAVATLIGRLFGSFFITQYIDKVGTKKIMMTTGLLRGCILGFILVLVGAGNIAIPVFYCLSFVISFLTACFAPARQKAVVEMVAREDLANANAFDGVSEAIVQILSWFSGGLVVATLGVFVALSVNAVTFFVSLSLVFASSWKQIVATELVSKGKIGVLAGLDIIKRNKILRGIIPLELIYMSMLGFFWAALPIKISEIGNAFSYGLQGAAFGLGFLITSTILSRKKIVRLSLVYMVGIIIHWVGNIGAGVSPNIYLFVIGVFVAGLGNSFWEIGKKTIFQTNTDKTDTGKVLATINMAINLCLIPSWILGGYLADRFTPTIVMFSVMIVQIVVVTIAFSMGTIKNTTK